MLQISDLESPEKSLKRLKRRSTFIFISIFLISLIGIAQILNLTVFNKQNYITVSENNRIITTPIYPSRGLIKIANTGELVTENIVSHSLVFSPKKINNPTAFLKALSSKIGLSKEESLRSERILKKNSKNIKRKITLIEDLSSQQVAKFLLSKNQFPSIALRAELKRFVLDDSLFSHALGYLGPISKEVRQDSDDYKYPLSAKVGKTGIEKSYEKVLRGEIGYKTVEVDVYGNEVRELSRTKSVKAEDINISLDKELQQLARNMMAGRKGAIVAMDPNTGFIKVLLSSPDFSPNVFNKSSSGSLKSMATNKDAPFFNRAISGNYPPASTLKPFLGLLGVDSQVISWDTKIEDKGFFQIKEGGRKYRGWKEKGHGEVQLKKAIVESSDVFFYELAAKLTIKRISDFLTLFGFGKSSGLDILEEGSGILPNRNWKLGAIGESWYVGDTINIGIGQGFITSTPLQLALAVSIIATKGKAYKPKIVEQIGETIVMPELLYEVEINEKQNWKKIEDSMMSVISSWNGTAHNLFEGRKVVIAGKTGTAQIQSLMAEDLTVQEEYKTVRKDEKNRDHALFVSYGPVPSPNLSVVVIIENGESGSRVAAPIAKAIIEKYQENLKEYE